MRVIPWLCCLVTHISTVNANVEKAIFLGPSPVSLANVLPNLADLRLDALSPTRSSSSLETQLAVEFPTTSSPRGVESWYILQGLEEGRRYEVRICWPATSPTDFWLDTYSITQVLDSSGLLASLARHSDQRQELLSVFANFERDNTPLTDQSILLLKVQAAASFYSANRTLMDHPPKVDVDIILDPFILNILPQSLAPFCAYLIIAAIGAWYLSRYIYFYLLLIASEPLPKSHGD
ncbi:hypothetical protein B0J11DRAFT_98599 [Dendryphion nanum]|uniref:Uncharacterized protein n=1 Tax=Dendryphion nanum TaxID=256645 RepID=A0A9P9DEY4_9PLEO|nr:hypothetical protein B0J11DRAFT_98599 [Dendryphion nanum]